MIFKFLGCRRSGKGYEAFNKNYPVGSIFRTMIKKQKFPYGKWKYLGINVDGSYLFERIK